MAKEKAAAPIVLRLDRSKRFSTVHGDRPLDDPHVNVSYIQDDLPYDADGILVPDDGRTDPIDVMHDGQRTRFFPLYTPKLREKLKRKLERVARGQQDDLEVTEHDDDRVKEDASEDVNLESWLRGEAKYPAFLIFAACKRRFSKNHTKIRDVVEDLVLEEKIVPEAQVDPHILKYITEKA
jgi:hypothetical protein